MRAAITVLCVVLLHTAPAGAQTPAGHTEDAVREAVQRQVFTIDLRQKLAEGQAAQRKGDYHSAAKLYEDCLGLYKKIGLGVEPEYQQLMDGYGVVRLQLAEQSQRAGDYVQADAQVSRVLKEDPKNVAAIAFKKSNDEIRLKLAGRMPSDEAKAKLPEAYQARVETATLVQDGKLLHEAGKLNEAEAKLRQAIKQDPSNKAAFHYLDIIKEKRYRQESNLREEWSKEQLLDVAKAWNPPIQRGSLPTPNPYARTNMVHSGKGRQAIYSKLERIRLDTVQYDGLPLGEVIKQLSEEARKRDPDKQGVNFLINAFIDPPPTAPGTVDPATGLPVAAVAAEPVILSQAIIQIVPALQNITLAQALDAIAKVSDRPIKYSIEDYAVVFSLKGSEAPALHTRYFKIDPNTFVQGLQGVSTFEFGNSTSSSSGGGGGGRSGGGGGRSGGGRSGGSGGGSGGGAGDESAGGSEYVGVRLAGSSRGFGQQGGAAAGGTPGAGGAAGGGINNLTVATPQDQIITVVRAFFTAAGVDLSPPKNIYFNDRLGMLMVRASMQDLDIIEQAVQVLNMSPPMLTIETKFAEVTQDDNKALGFDWFLGNVIVGGNSALSGGTQPSLQGKAAGTKANPIPGSPFPNPIIPQSFSDQLITGGLRNTGPALASYTGILTDPQFRVVIRALEQRSGVDLLSAPKITTLSARQAQIKVVDVRYVVTDLDVDQTSGGGNNNQLAQPGVNTGGGGVGSLIQPIAEPIELGPVLDVVPYVSADGFTVQMTIIPTIKEFVGYDLETAELFQAQAQSVGTGAGGALQQRTPLPIFRLRQVVTSANVWDGQTVVLGGLISENVTKTKDKVPLLGDLPIAGRFFRSESSMTKKKNLVIFVTPTIIDPAGNRVHSEEELPFAKNAFPAQTPITP